MMINLCRFAVRVGHNTLPPHTTPLQFIPRLGGDPPIRTLLGYDPPPELPTIPAGEVVIVPRFAAAVAWARQAHLVPMHAPLAHHGQRGQPGGAPELVLGLEELAYTFPLQPYAPADWANLPIQRMVRGGWSIRARGIGRQFNPCEDYARDLPNGEVHIPHIRHEDGIQGVIVPQSGAVIRYLRGIVPNIAIFVTGVPDPQTKEVDLYQV